MKEKLPQGWIDCTLGDIVKVQNGYAFPSKEFRQAGVPLIRQSNLDGNKVSLEKCVYLDPSWLDVKPDFVLRENDVLIGMSGSVGKLCIYDLDGPALQNQRTGKIVPCSTDFIDWRFMWEYLKTVEQRLLRKGKGMGVINVSGGDIESLPFLLAPLKEQRRIVAKLEELLNRVDTARARLATIPSILKRFRQSVLAAACSGRLTADWREENPKVERATTTIDKLKATGAKVRRGVPESVQVTDLVLDWELPEKWAFYSTAELLRCGAFVDVKDGNHGANHPRVSEFTKTGLPFITAAQVNNYRIDYERAYKLSGEPLDRIRVGFAKSGDVIYTHKGSVGRVAVADRDCVLTPQTTYYRVNPDVFLNRFVMFYLASQAFSEQVNVVKEQTTRDFVPISEQYLFFHRVPPFAEQKEIVRRVEALFKTAAELEARYCKAKAHVDKLTQSILAKAFRGELVPQDPNDEPASELLARIVKERAQSSRKPTKSPKT